MDVVADFFSPSRDEALDDILSNLMRIMARSSMGAQFLSCGNRTRRLLFVVVQRIEESEIQKMERECFGMIPWSIWIPGRTVSAVAANMQYQHSST